jgi:hypothetical protein
MSENRPNHSEEKLEPADLAETSPAMKWLDNFWYHYKWTVIVVLFFVSVITVAIVQFATRPEYDIHIVYAGYYRMDSAERARFEDTVNGISPRDFDGNGEKLVNLRDFQIYSEQEIIEEQSRYEAESDHFEINPEYNADELNSFTNYTLTGDSSVYIISPSLYKNLKGADRLAPLTELYPDGNLPAGAMADGFGIAFGETDFYRYNPSMQVLQEDLVLCILKPNLVGANSQDKNYSEAKEFFRAMADYRVEQ